MKNAKKGKIKSLEEEAEHWMAHDTASFWDSFEDVKDPMEISPALKQEVRARHEKAKAISIRLYPSQLRAAKAIANKRRVPYQVLLRSIIDKALAHAAE